MGIKKQHFCLKKQQHDTPHLSFSHPWTRETRSNDFWVFSKMADHSLIPRSSPLFKMAVESNFPPWGPLWMSKSPPTCALLSLIPVCMSTHSNPFPHLQCVSTKFPFTLQPCQITAAAYDGQKHIFPCRA